MARWIRTLLAALVLAATAARAEEPPPESPPVVGDEAVPCDHEEEARLHAMEVARAVAGLSNQVALAGGPILEPAAGLRLEAVDVRIRLDTPDRRFRPGPFREQRIEWRVVNERPAREVTVRFPYGWTDPPPRSPTGPSIEGLVLIEDVGVGDAAWLACAASDLKGAAWAEPTGLAARAACEARVRLPAGTSTLVFRTSLPALETWSLAEGRRVVAYDFAAERALGGRPRLVTITLEPLGGGWSEPFIPALPAGGVVQADGRLRWRFEAPDLGHLKVFAMAATRASYAPYEAGALGTGFGARASSALPPQGRFRFDAAQALDGDPATAWCEGAKGEGAGEWLEVTANLTPRGAAACVLDGFLLLPGHGASLAAWRRNGRAARIRIAPCADPGGGAVFELPEVDPFGKVAEGLALDPEAVQHLDIPAGPPPAHRLFPGPPLLQASDGCWRLTALEVRKGQDPDLCVAEFQPEFHCGPR